MEPAQKCGLNKSVGLALDMADCASMRHVVVDKVMQQ